MKKSTVLFLHPCSQETLDVCIVFVAIDKTVSFIYGLYFNLRLQAVNILFLSEKFLGLSLSYLICPCYSSLPEIRCGECGEMASPVSERPLKPGFYRVELFKTIWEVPTRYQDLSPIGTGAYGTVW